MEDLGYHSQPSSIVQETYIGVNIYTYMYVVSGLIPSLSKVLLKNHILLEVVKKKWLMQIWLLLLLFNRCFDRFGFSFFLA